MSISLKELEDLPMYMLQEEKDKVQAEIQKQTEAMAIAKNIRKHLTKKSEERTLKSIQRLKNKLIAIANSLQQIEDFYGKDKCETCQTPWTENETEEYCDDCCCAGCGGN